MKTPKISVIIPSFNKVRFISQTLDSIIKQEYPNLEVIVQDGGSTDGTYEKVKKYSQKYPNIFQIESKRDGGQVNAINDGLNKAKGEIVTYINADDVYMPKTFSMIANSYMKHSDVLWFAGQGKVVGKKGNEIARLSSWYKNMLLVLNMKSCLLVTNYLTQPSVFITKRAFQKFGPFTGLSSGVVMEYGLWLRLSKISMPIIIKKTLSAFRLTKDNFSSNDYKNILKNDEVIVKRFTKSILIIFFHKLHNLLRVVTLKLIN